MFLKRMELGIPEGYYSIPSPRQWKSVPGYEPTEQVDGVFSSEQAFDSLCRKLHLSVLCHISALPLKSRPSSYALWLIDPSCIQMRGSGSLVSIRYTFPLSKLLILLPLEERVRNSKEPPKT